MTTDPRQLPSYQRQVAIAHEWSKRADVPAYVYLTRRGWRWTADCIIAHRRSATSETVIGYTD